MKATAFLTLKDKVLKDDIVTQAAALAFYTALAVSPVILLFVTFFSSLNLPLQEQLFSEIRGLMGSDAASVIETIISSSDEKSSQIRSADLWGFLTLGVSASVIFSQLQSALNLIFASPPKGPEKTGVWELVRHFLLRRLFCFGMLLTCIFISIVSLMVSGFLSLLSIGYLGTVMEVIHNSGTYIVYTLLFAIILKWMPDRTVRWKPAFAGGALTAILFVLGKVLIDHYIRRTAVGSAYGAAGSFIVFLVWIYYSTLIFLFGAEISAQMSSFKNLRS